MLIYCTITIVIKTIAIIILAVAECAHGPEAPGEERIVFRGTKDAIIEWIRTQA